MLHPFNLGFPGPMIAAVGKGVSRNVAECFKVLTSHKSDINKLGTSQGNTLLGRGGGNYGKITFAQNRK